MSIFKFKIERIIIELSLFVWGIALIWCNFLFIYFIFLKSLILHVNIHTATRCMVSLWPSMSCPLSTLRMTCAWFECTGTFITLPIHNRTWIDIPLPIFTFRRYCFPLFIVSLQHFLELIRLLTMDDKTSNRNRKWIGWLAVCRAYYDVLHLQPGVKCCEMVVPDRPSGHVQLSQNSTRMAKLDRRGPTGWSFWWWSSEAKSATWSEANEPSTKEWNVVEPSYRWFGPLLSEMLIPPVCGWSGYSSTSQDGIHRCTNDKS